MPGGPGGPAVPRPPGAPFDDKEYLVISIQLIMNLHVTWLARFTTFTGSPCNANSWWSRRALNADRSHWTFKTYAIRSAFTLVTSLASRTFWSRWSWYSWQASEASFSRQAISAWLSCGRIISVI